VARARAGLASCRAVVSQAQATLDVNRSDRDKAVIHSPINGVVLTRQIEPGQTVAAAFEALFFSSWLKTFRSWSFRWMLTRRMSGGFTRDRRQHSQLTAYPDKHFPATITQVRYGSKTTEGVVRIRRC